MHTVIAVTIALVIAYLLVASINGDVAWLLSEGKNLPNFIGGAVCVILAGGFIGQYTGRSIFVRNKECLLGQYPEQFLYPMAGNIFGFMYWFFQEGIHDPFGLFSGLDNYIVKPLLLITIFGCIPTAIIALVLAWSIKRKRANKESK